MNHQQWIRAARRILAQCFVGFVTCVVAPTQHAVAGDGGLAHERPWYLGQVLAQTGLESAWSHGQGRDIVIAIIDSGVDASHPDLRGRVLPGFNLVEGNQDTSDHTGHGTAVAAAAAAALSSDGQSSGLAPQARILPLKVTDARGYTNARYVRKAMEWALDHGARIINVSFEDVWRHSTVQQMASRLYAAGAVVVVPSGNRGRPPWVAWLSGEATDGFLAAASPDLKGAAAHTDSVTFEQVLVVVGASDDRGRRAWWSTSGGFVDLLAPGVDLMLPAMGGGYESRSGSSFSSALIAGAAALVLSQDQALGSAQIKRSLLGASLAQSTRPALITACCLR